MNDAFSKFIEHGKKMAEDSGLNWDFPFDSNGFSTSGWNLTQITKGLPPTHYLRDFSVDKKIDTLLRVKRQEQFPPVQYSKVINESWRNLIKAATCEQLFFRRNTTSHIVQNVIRPLKILATCAGACEPWQLNVDVVREAVDAARAMQPSGKMADLIVGVVKNIFDMNHLAEACPLYPVLKIERMAGTNIRTASFVKTKKQLIDILEERKGAERLPEKKAFWELVRIIFTEKPLTFTDSLRFGILQVMVLCGLRLGEAVLLPADWKRTREYYDPSGLPAGELGGCSKSLMLRHFAEKQKSENSNSILLFETTQYIPEMFEEILTNTLNSIALSTQPLRDTLKHQIQTERFFPWYDNDDLVPVSELYTRITGNPFWLGLPQKEVDNFLDSYRQSFSPEILLSLHQRQLNQYRASGELKALNSAMYVYFNRLMKKKPVDGVVLSFRKANGDKCDASRKCWSDMYFRVGELEEYLKINLPTKSPDTTEIHLTTGILQPYELMFLNPKRSLAEERNEGITDISRYYSVGIPDTTLISSALGCNKFYRESIFKRYGKNDEDRNLTLEPRALRHLQNTELFRLGIADTIISKRYNRKSIVQSYEYDHRSLEEDLASIDIPIETEVFLGERPSAVLKMIASGKASGPIVDRFKRIQRENGDEDAFEFLKIEADGFHVTPYGFCINSFTVDPCPKNLECFAGCGHLAATNLPENIKNLKVLEQRLVDVISEATSKPPGTVAIKNQIEHATIRLNGVRQTLATSSGDPVFPGGPDFSLQKTRRSVLDE